MNTWREHLRYDPLPPLLAAENEALRYFTRRDLLDEEVAPGESLWQLPQVEKILRKQLSDGAWRYPGGGKAHLRSAEDYNQLETYRNLAILVEKYGLHQRHPAIARAAEFVFSRQTDEGDFRGIYGTQYTPNYSAAIMELLIKAGYADDPRIAKGLCWLLAMRQHDGGWAIPLSTMNARWDVETLGAATVQPDRTKPFSHLCTGVVLRAFAAHPVYRRSGEAGAAGSLLAARLFLPDAYPGRGTIKFWTSFCFPFWFTDLLSALDSLTLLGFTCTDPQVNKAWAWFVTHQEESGSWNLYILHGASDKETGLWAAFAICRVGKRLQSAY
jgi:hypothetical protein